MDNLKLLNFRLLVIFNKLGDGAGSIIFMKILGGNVQIIFLEISSFPLFVRTRYLSFCNNVILITGSLYLAGEVLNLN